MRIGLGLMGAASLALIGCGADTKAAPVQAVTADIVPARTLRCVLGRATNLDASKKQTYADIRYEGRYGFELYLPPAPVRQGPPPDPTDPAEPVDPDTRITADPGGLTAGVPKRFDRVVDLWPERVEMMTIIDPPLVNLIIVHPIDPARGTAKLFMTKAQDAASMDLDRVYQGDCTISAGRPG